MDSLNAVFITFRGVNDELIFHKDGTYGVFVHSSDDCLCMALVRV